MGINYNIIWKSFMEISPMGLFGYKYLSKYLIAYHSVCDYVILYVL